MSRMAAREASSGRFLLNTTDAKSGKVSVDNRVSIRLL